MKFVKKHFENLKDSMDIDDMTEGQMADYLAAESSGQQSEYNGVWWMDYECPSCHNRISFSKNMVIRTKSKKKKKIWLFAQNQKKKDLNFNERRKKTKSSFPIK